jgi:hypothetical protein
LALAREDQGRREAARVAPPAARWITRMACLSQRCVGVVPTNVHQRTSNGGDRYGPLSGLVARLHDGAPTLAAEPVTQDRGGIHAHLQPSYLDSIRKTHSAPRRRTVSDIAEATLPLLARPEPIRCVVTRTE